MPLVALSGGFFFPKIFPSASNAGAGFTGTLLDSANESIALVFQIRNTGTISKVGFQTGTVNTGANVDIRLETVAATGNPSGTLYQSSSNIIFSIPDTDDNVWETVTLGSGTLVQAGSTLALRVQMNATSAGLLNIRRFGATDPAYSANFPYQDIFQGGSWTKSYGQNPLFGIEYSDGSYPFTEGIYPIQNFSTVAYNTASTVDERGILFSFPFPTRAIGCWAELDQDISCSAILYNSDTTSVLQTIKIDSNNRSTTTPDRSHFMFVSATTFVAANTYRLTFVPDPGGTISLTEWIGSSTAVMGQFDGYPMIMETSRADSGAWTNDNRVYPVCGLILDAFDDGTGSGSTTVTQAAGVWGF